MKDQDRIKLEAELAEAKALPGPVLAYQEIDRLRADLAVARERVRQIEAALPSTYYSDRDPATRVRFMVEQWQRAVTANQQLEAEVAEAQAKNARLAAALVHVAEYWNGAHTEEAMRDACEHIPMAANEALMENNTALNGLLGPVEKLLARFTTDEHGQPYSGPSQAEINEVLAAVRAAMERKT